MSNVYSKDEISGFAYALWVLRYQGISVFMRKFYDGLITRIVLYTNLFWGQRRPGMFRFSGWSLPYFSGTYNIAWLNERSVEVPIASRVLQDFEHKRILEVGAVLGHYVDVSWDVLDKFEKRKDIINEDIVDFSPNQKYDLVISISTLEHVGWDDDVKESAKVKEAVASIKKQCLKLGGTFIATMPMGYNSGLDGFVKDESLGFDRMLFLKRVSIFNEWKEVSKDEAISARYGWPYNNGNVIVVGVVGDLDDL